MFLLILYESIGANLTWNIHCKRKKEREKNLHRKKQFSQKISIMIVPTKKWNGTSNEGQKSNWRHLAVFFPHLKCGEQKIDTKHSFSKRVNRWASFFASNIVAALYSVPRNILPFGEKNSFVKLIGHSYRTI